MDNSLGRQAWIILPAFNEAENLVSLLKEIAAVARDCMQPWGCCIVVVNDGSVDNTATVVESFRAATDKSGCSRLRVTLLKHETNLGLAAALRTGFTYCCDHAGDEDAFVVMDSDNSHSPTLLPEMLERVSRSCDVVIASRYRRGSRVVGVPLQRLFLSWAARWIFKLFFPIRGVRDYTCGFRAYRSALIKGSMKEHSDFISERGFTCMVDILLKLRRQTPTVVMCEVPLTLRYVQKKGGSKMKVARTVIQSLRLIFRRLVHPARERLAP